MGSPCGPRKSPRFATTQSATVLPVVIGSSGSSISWPGTMFSDRQPVREATLRMPVSGSAVVGPWMLVAPLGQLTNERRPEGWPTWIGGLKSGPIR